VRQDRRVDVNIDDPRSGRGLLGDLVHVALGEQSAAIVDELPDAAFAGQVAHGPLQVAAVVAGQGVTPRHQAGREVISPDGDYWDSEYAADQKIRHSGLNAGAGIAAGQPAESQGDTGRPVRGN
jgi:hypothetical protein